MTSAYRMLCVGDVHLGRHPTRVPVRDDRLTVAHVWRQCVDAAVQRDVDAVILPGDVVDRENKMYEAFGTLQRGVRRLTDAGIDVVAVAGNHDFDALPRLVDALDAPRLHLLGRGGTWETLALPATDPRIRFVGWSFPEAHVTASPVDDLSVDGLDLEAGALPTVGVMHGEVGASQSRYAPAQRSALADVPATAWVLGHIHAPGVHREGRQLQLYVGSPQPLDPGETGPHGAWIVEVRPERRAQARPVPRATVRYAPVTVDVTDAADADAVERAVLDGIRARLAAIVDETPTVRRVATRLHIEGRTHLHREIEAMTDALHDDLTVHVDDTTATLDAITIDTRPAHDLEALADGGDTPAVLAQLLLDLEQGRDTDAVTDLLQRTREAAHEVHDASGYAPLRRDGATQDPPSDATLREILHHRGLLLLDELHAQTGADPRGTGEDENGNAKTFNVERHE